MSGNISGRLDRATASRSFTKRAPLGVRIMLRHSPSWPLHSPYWPA